MNTIDLTAQSRQRREQYHSKDTYSSGYLRAIRKVREHCWYDVHPYSLAIWPSLYSDKVRTGKWWIQRQNYHGIAVELQIEGTTLYKTDSGSAELQPGEFHLTVPGSTVRLSGGPPTGRQQLRVISGGWTNLRVESLNLSSSRKIHFDNESDRKRIQILLGHIADLLQEHRLDSALENSTSGYGLICLLADYSSRFREDGLPPPLTHAVQMMANGYGSQFSIGELAAALGISRVTLNNLFRQYLNTTPQAYRHRICMENAVQLVRSGEYSFKEISEQLGFRNSLYFSTVFRRYTGMTPTEYRRHSAETQKKIHSAETADSTPSKR